MAYLNVADRQKNEVGNIGVDSEQNDADDGERSVECSGFNDHHRGSKRDGRQ